MNSDRFYRLLSEHSNYMDPEAVVRVYLALIIVINKELQKNKFIRLPALGDLALVRQKSRPAWVGRSHCVIDGREVLKFYAKEAFRRHYNARQQIQALSHMPPPPIK